ncbi:NAD(+) synthase [Acutalibacter caecimuris]|uniref:NAD(+) synthase n=1 Tax=Acutalibacter caecimuris TaxID=3093657 RepID=UPI002AC95F29|nr:NAD(+) synthase [Acutalibacter sp. M00118]
MKDGFIRIASATPRGKVADVGWNVEQVRKLIEEAAKAGCGVVCLPELAVTAYTCGDLFQNRVLLTGAERGLRQLLEETAGLDIVCVVGAPVAWQGSLYNCAAVFHRGRLLGLPAKTAIPNYGEFYEARYFTPAGAPQEVVFCGQRAWMGKGLLFPCENVEGLVLGVEICEDLWGAEPPSARLAQNGATLICNPSCSDEVAGKAGYRQDLVKMWSGHIMSGYLYADAGPGESTGDMVFAGHDIIAENGGVLAESQLFSTGLTMAEIDLERLMQERRRANTWQDRHDGDLVRIPFAYNQGTLAAFSPERQFSSQPFVPEDPAAHGARCQMILTMQAQGLATRMRHIGCKSAVIAFSGGLDSTLAALVAVRAFDLLGLPRAGILAISMPCFGTTGRTKHNAQCMAQELGMEFREQPIAKTVLSHFGDIGQDPENYDVTFENAQARERMQVAMDIANQRGGLVIGTGDLSELALGWATYNGDHMSMYGVNADVPKTLVRHLVRYEAERLGGRLGQVLFDVLDTPVSPELLPPKDGEIAQKTEELVGPYELHDFFLYYLLRYGFGPGKIYRMACRSFAGQFAPDMIKGWLRVFYRRFFAQQFKRSCLPDGPKVGTVGLSPRGDWRMPSDGWATLWLEEIEGL